MGVRNKIKQCKYKTKLGVVLKNIMKYDDLNIYNKLNKKINDNWILIEEKCKLYIQVYGYEKLYDKYKNREYIMEEKLNVGYGKIKIVKVFRNNDFISDMIKYDDLKYKKDCKVYNEKQISNNNHKFFKFDIGNKLERDGVNWELYFIKLNELIEINNLYVKEFNDLCSIIRKTYPKVILKEGELGIKRLDFTGNETIKVDGVLFDEYDEYGIIKFLITRTTNQYEWLGKYGYGIRSTDKLTHYLRVKCDEIISERDVEGFRNGKDWINKWI
jgi:hypothetical protein